ncbi:hypothetical protein BDZ94DRAFT_1195735 [Collybia nuda]|uniref:Uncharacterized protein n=1 Tax=Collybia nuda TaxID=64659 RepID=A0A9P5Y3W0_9AGAR|nr:hypothetical protein BDZ94DRAFT_1195735 [Collybia nuda]
MSSTAISRYPNFEPDPTVSLIANFKRLAVQEGWGKKSKKYKEERRGYLGEAVTIAFVSLFGGNVSSLQAWQSLCETIGVPERKDGEVVNLTSIHACQEALKGVYVNLVDLVDAKASGNVISRKFTSTKALAKYIRNTGKYFPKGRAKSNPLLRRFLIVVSEH